MLLLVTMSAPGGILLNARHFTEQCQAILYLELTLPFKASTCFSLNSFWFGFSCKYTPDFPWAFFFFWQFFLSLLCQLLNLYQQLNVGVPQNSVLDPPFFVLYSFPWENIINSHDFSYLYTEEPHIFTSGTDHTSEWQIWIGHCLQDNSNWMSQRHSPIL